VTALLEVRDVTKRYGSLAALAGVSFDVGEGEIVGLIGPNGAGKTTLVNVVSGSAPPWAGEIRFGGRSLRDLRPHRIGRLGIARTFQVAQPFAGMTVLENVVVGGLYGHAEGSVGGARSRAEALLRELDLAEKANEPAETLNAPERKRLEVARALSTDPQLLLLDEVMAGLNPSEVDLTIELVRRVHRRGVTIVLIEHVMQAIAKLADRVVVLHHGLRFAEGPTDEVLRDERVVGAYLGSRRRHGSPISDA
jgi:branched-chain amino acid transport system ATP-binding protein